MKMKSRYNNSLNRKSYLNKGVPSNAEGRNGDSLLCLLNKGVVLCYKIEGQWRELAFFRDIDITLNKMSLNELTISSLKPISSDTDKFLMSDNGTIKYVTGANLLSYIGGSSTTGTVTSVGTTGTVNGLTLTGTVTTSGNLTLGGTLAINNGDWSGTDLAVANGGTGASDSNAWLNSRITTNANGSLNYDATGATAVNHNSLTGYDADEHIDWTSASAGTIDASNYTNTTYSVMASGNSYAAGLVAAGSGTHSNQFLRKDGTWVVPENDNTNQLTTFTVSATTDSNATTISQGDDLMFTAGTGITCETTADGTVTITNTVSAPTNYVTNDANDEMAGSLTLKKVADDATGRSLVIEKHRATATTANDDDVIGQIEWKAYNDAGTPELGTFAAIKTTVVDASNASETGMIEFQVLGTHEFSDDNTPVTALKLTGISGNYEHADVQIGTGLPSTITGLCSTVDLRMYTAYDRGRILLKPANPTASTTASITLESHGDADDLFKIETATTGVTTISTVDDGGAAAHIKFEPDGSFLIKETASAGASVAAYGQLWVKSDTPNELYFTTDAGDDIQITSGTSMAGGGGSSGLNSIIAAMVFG